MFVAKGYCALSELKRKTGSLASSALTVLAMLGHIHIENTLALVSPKNAYNIFFLDIKHKGFSCCFSSQPHVTYRGSQ